MVAYGFDASQRMIWFEHFDANRGALMAGRLCRRHAESLIPPKGWWVDDRRVGGGDSLFEPPAPVVVDRTARSGRGEPVGPVASAPELPFESGSAEPTVASDESVEAVAIPTIAVDEPVVGPVISADPDDDTESAWTPEFDVTDDVRGLLNARTPLLRRAFTAGVKRKPQ
jgi:hypothetical protein